MNYDKNTREGRHLTQEERIALQAEEIKQLWQENEQLRAQAARMREVLEQFKYDYEQNCPIHQNYLAVCRLLREDTVQAYHNPADVAEIEKLRNVIEEIKDNLHAINCVREMPDKVEMYANEAISIIDEMGGKEDV